MYCISVTWDVLSSSCDNILLVNLVLLTTFLSYGIPAELNNYALIIQNISGNDNYQIMFYSVGFFLIFSSFVFFLFDSSLNSHFWVFEDICLLPFSTWFSGGSTFDIFFYELGQILVEDAKINSYNSCGLYAVLCA